jgi:hypothetical protein
VESAGPKGILRVERIGGVAGFGGTRSRIRSRGEIEFDALSVADRAAVERLFLARGKKKVPQSPDAFSYRITRESSRGSETVEADEADVPVALMRCIKDELE